LENFSLPFGLRHWHCNCGFRHFLRSYCVCWAGVFTYSQKVAVIEFTLHHRFYRLSLVACFRYLKPCFGNVQARNWTLARWRFYSTYWCSFFGIFAPLFSKRNSQRERFMKTLFVPQHLALTPIGILDFCEFTLSSNRIAFLTGKNGAGKTTALSYLFCQKNKIFGDQASVYYVEQNLSRQSILCETLTAREFCCLGNQSLHLLEQMKIAFQLFRIAHTFHLPISKLSGGEWKKLQLAKAWISESEVCLLDEPTASLDDISQSDFYNIWKQRTSVSGNIWNIIVSHENPLKLQQIGEVFLLLNKLVRPF
jgi:ATPase subunit of ABC transporter with duplicated ATPase domains